MKQLTPKTVLVLDWYDVQRAFAEHAGISFSTIGHWNLDYTKPVAAEPNFDGMQILQHEQDYLYPYDTCTKQYAIGDLQEILNKSEKCDFKGKTYYRIPFRFALDYLVFHGVIPDDNFFVTNLVV